MDKVNMVKNTNRRRVFRVYEEANLFYKKIDQSLVVETQPVVHKILDDYQIVADLDGVTPNVFMPDLDENWPVNTDFRGNSPQHINLSESGIAFTCDDSLKEGDYLAMKIMLKSGIEDILTYAKVVYCKASQDGGRQFPAFVGAHFVNMKKDDHESIIKYVDKKKMRLRWASGFILAAVLTVLAAPGAIFGLVFEFLHFVLELLLEFSHLGFEFIESNLDHLIEHLFETDLHGTQIIVFYIIFFVASFGLYRLWRFFPPFCLRIKNNLLANWLRKKASLSYFWREQPLINKIRLVVICVVIFTGYIFFGM
jgi:hypothetical protein